MPQAITSRDLFQRPEFQEVCRILDIPLDKPITELTITLVMGEAVVVDEKRFCMHPEPEKKE